jgi:hypothetical protein
MVWWQYKDAIFACHGSIPRWTVPQLMVQLILIWRLKLRQLPKK